ncbi:MAG: succinate dehydrogenase cytochrome b subunit [Saprospiraceae bacterium]|nr:succinate dehydrogenase cytochrome b subunit [Saprospiraceae bacterium]
MNWIVVFLKSSLGKKIIMSLTGLFLCLFLVVHLIGNLQLLKDDAGEAFNTYAYFMTHNPLILLVSYMTYFFIVLHTIQGLTLFVQNRSSRKQGYSTKKSSGSSFSSRNMALLGSFILLFLVTHMGDFWYKMHKEYLPTVSYEGYENIQDLYIRVSAAFDQWWIVLFYVLGMIILAYHLQHGFQSAFQSLGINHPKYTPIIKGFGIVFCLLLSAGFASIPIYHFFFR